MHSFLTLFISLIKLGVDPAPQTVRVELVIAHRLQSQFTWPAAMDANRTQYYCPTLLVFNLIVSRICLAFHRNGIHREKLCDLGPDELLGV